MIRTTRAVRRIRAMIGLVAAFVLVALSLTAGSATAATTTAGSASVAAAATSWCGAACNGVNPKTPVYVGAYKVVCANTARQVDGPLYPSSPAGEGQPISYDKNMYAYHMYSTQCQTT